MILWATRRCWLQICFLRCCAVSPAAGEEASGSDVCMLAMARCAISSNADRRPETCHSRVWCPSSRLAGRSAAEDGDSHKNLKQKYGKMFRDSGPLLLRENTP